MIKVADIYVSDDGCGDFILRLRGSDARYFVLKGKEVYLKDDIAIESRIYKIQISLENLPNTLPQKYIELNIDRRNCFISVTTTGGPTTTTTSGPTTTTTTTTLDPSCVIIQSNNNTTNRLNTGVYIDPMAPTLGQKLTILSTGSIDVGSSLYPGYYGPDGVTEAGTDPRTGATYRALLGQIGTTGPIFQDRKSTRLNSSHSRTF
jgi:hypothetical protein